MKTSLGLLGVSLLSVTLGCANSSPGDNGTGGHSGAGTGGAPPAGSGGKTTGGSGGNGAGGVAVGTGGTTGAGGGMGTGGGNGGAGAGGRAMGTGGAGAGGMTGAGGGAAPFTCPAGPFTGAIPNGSTATRIAGAPPNDTFSNNGNDFMNVEGPVWIGDSLYVSEMKGSPNPPQTRIIQITAADVVTVAVPPDSGSNGMAVDAAGNLVTANHGVGGIVTFSLPAFTRTTLVSMYNGKRFNSPNDLTIRNDGTIYFSDPTFQAPNPTPQSAQRVYMVRAGSGTATAIVDNASNPNGVALSLDQKFLFVGDGSGVMRYALATDGTLMGAGTAIDTADFANNASDGMAMDCAGNLYVVRVNQHDIIVVKDPTGAATKTGQITIPGAGNLTNAAFGGTDHKTLYVTAQGTGMQRGVFKLAMPIPGLPY